MKFIKICIAALSFGTFATACHNADCNTSKSDSTSVSQAVVSPTDGTGAAANAAADTTAGKTAQGINAPVNTGSDQKGLAHSRARYRRGGKQDTLASNGPDVNASKKREGNFTNGTGSDNPGR